MHRYGCAGGSEQSQCPPEEKFLDPWALVFQDGKEVSVKYEEWFTDGGAFDLGAQLLLVDLTVTNVDAVAEGNVERRAVT